MAEYVEIVRSCAAYSRPDLESPEVFRLEAGTVAELLRDEDRLFFKAAYGGQPVYIPKECAALTDTASTVHRDVRQLDTQRDEMTCHSCGSAIKRGISLCPRCGAHVATAPEAASRSTARAVSQPSPQAMAGKDVAGPGGAPTDDRDARELTTEPEEMFCQSCGSAIKRDVRFCPQCGAGVATAPEAASRSAVGLAEPGRAFASGRSMAWLAVIALALVIIMDVVGLISGIAEVRLVTRAINGEFVTLQELEDNDNRQAVVGFLQLAVLAVAAILFLVWMYRAHRNLPALGASGLDYSPNWAVGGWFIPIMNLWRPYQVTAEIWKASDPDSSHPEGQAWRTAPVSLLLKFWWALWIISGIIGNIVLRSAFQEPEDLEALRTQSLTFIAADVIDIPAAILAILVVWHITTRQDEKSRKLRRAAGLRV